MVSETKNKLNKLFISTFIEWIARLSIERFWFIFWQYERPTNWHQFLARRLIIFWDWFAWNQDNVSQFGEIPGPGTVVSVS
jgi:uncharacterized membrane protein